MLNVEKLTAMSSYFLSKGPREGIQHIKLMKLLYISEREHLRDYYSTICSLKFASLEHGPVISDGLDVMTGNRKEQFWDEHVEYLAMPTRWRLKGDAIDISDYLSEVEIDTLRKVFIQYGSLKQQEIRDITHKFREWNPEAETRQTSFPIELETILVDALKFEPDVANEVIDELKFYHSLSA